jgi:hypothetical protein
VDLDGRERERGARREADLAVELDVAHRAVLVLAHRARGHRLHERAAAVDTACASARSSSRSANVPGTGSPWIEVCSGRRLVENASAPARIPSRTSSAIAARSAAVAGCWSAPRLPIT